MNNPIQNTKKYLAGIHQFVTVGTGSTSVAIPDIISQADVNVMTLQNGNVGIGTVNPKSTLHVVGNILSTGNLTASNISVIGDFVTLNTVTSNTEQMVITNAGTGPALKVTQTGDNSVAEFYDNESGIALFVGNNGNVGVGTTNPVQKLDVNGIINYKTQILKNNTPVDYDIYNITTKIAITATGNNYYYIAPDQINGITLNPNKAYHYELSIVATTTNAANNGFSHIKANITSSDGYHNYRIIRVSDIVANYQYGIANTAINSAMYNPWQAGYNNIPLQSYITGTLYGCSTFYGGYYTNQTGVTNYVYPGSYLKIWVLY